MIAQDNPMMHSFVGTVMQLTAEEKVAQACEMRRRYSNEIATYEEKISSKFRVYRNFTSCTMTGFPCICI